MKQFLGIFLCVAMFGNSIFAISQADQNYSKAMEYIDTRGEVYLRFYADLDMKLNEQELGLMLDKAIGSEVYAYANKVGFEKFAQQDIPFEIVTPPGLAGEAPKMSSDPDDIRQWDSFPTASGYVAMMEKFAVDYPDLCVVEEYGKSVENKELLVAKISKDVGDHQKEPAFFYQGTIHGDEVVSYVLLLRLIDYLLSNYDSDDQVKNLVDNLEIYISPSGNPDGIYRGGDETVSGSARTNANGKDLNRNFPCPSLNGGINSSHSPAQVETITLIDWLEENPIAMAGDCHSGVVYVCYIWGCWSKTMVDEPWWQDISKAYVKDVRDNSPSSYWEDQSSGFCNSQGWENAYDWYEVQGERMNHASYYQDSRSLTIELSWVKKLAASQLDDHWNHNFRAFLNYMEQALYGIHGSVSDSIEGDPLEAKVTIDGHDNDNSHVFSHAPHGDFYRYIEAGTYDLTIADVDDKYFPKTVSVTVKDGEKTTCDVKLYPRVTDSKNSAVGMQKADLAVFNSGSDIVFNVPVGWEQAQLTIHDVHGKLLENVALNNSGHVQWHGNGTLGNGYYIVRLQKGTQILTQNFVFTR